MNLMTKKFGPYPMGIWIALIALLLAFLGWLMQAYSLLDWEGAVKLGLQNGSFEGDAVERAVANKERGEAIADMLWPLPIAIVALIGLLRNEFIGFVAAMMEFAICIYFPLFYTFQLWNTDIETVIGANVLWAIPSLLGIIGLWANRQYFN
ncbi:MAG: hypothetical protein P9L92_10280 [Candidatus Electryonea clarkiae]|nr:hypothetical protein [Candidatus Electryonea clarkiae]MDP8285579.1 hypothetical protein [Candidatus Electryonea clarkiae]